MADKPNDSQRKNSKEEGKDHKKNGSLGGSGKEKKKDGDRKEKKERKSKDGKDSKDGKETKDKKTPRIAGTSSSSKPKPKDKPATEAAGPSAPLNSSKGKETDGPAKRDSLGMAGNVSPAGANSERRLSAPASVIPIDMRRPTLPSTSRFRDLHVSKGETPSDFIIQSLLGEFKEQAKRKIEEMMSWELVSYPPHSLLLLSFSNSARYVGKELVVVRSV